jgi:ABC-type phosphate transport system substrate-binding protein
MFSPPRASAADGDIAVVVNSGVPVNTLTFAEVRKLFFGDRQYWTPDLRVTLVVRAPVAREREIALRTIYQMTEAQFRQYWISKVFRAEATSGPRIVYSSEEATGLVGALPGAISFIDVTQVPKGFKVLRVDGHLPGEPGYRLH